MNKLVSPIASKRRRQAINENLENYYKQQEKQTLNENVILEAQKETEKEEELALARDVARKDKERRDSFKDNTDDFDHNVKETLSSLFGVIVYEALPIDDEAKEEDSEAIIEGAKDIFKTLYESESVIITQSPTFKEYTGTVVKHIDNFKGRLSQEQIEEVLSTIFSDHYIDLSNTIKNVYDKSANAIRTETEIKNYREEKYDDDFIKTNSNYVKENFTPTLFRYLNESVIEQITKSDDVSKLKRQDILNISLAESLSRYVILETLNTTKLIEFDMDSLKNTIKY